MSLYTSEPGGRDTCHLADFLPTFTAYKGHEVIFKFTRQPGGQSDMV